MSALTPLPKKRTEVEPATVVPDKQLSLIQKRKREVKLFTVGKSVFKLGNNDCPVVDMNLSARDKGDNHFECLLLLVLWAQG